MVNQLPNDEPTLQTAFCALSISRVGRDNKDMRLVRESSKAYGKALRDLQTALFDKGRAGSDQVLTACLLLSMYEVYEGSSKKAFGWVSHVQGAARLLELRGPERHQTWQAHHVFLGARVPIIYAGILDKRATFLATQPWLTIPWEKGHKVYFDRAIDLATQIPGILQEIEYVNLNLFGTQARRALHKLLEQCKSLLKALHTWHMNMKKGSEYTVIKHDSWEDDKYPFDVELWFPNHLFAFAHIFFWTCAFNISEAIQEVQEALEDLYQQKDQRPNLVWRAELFESRQYALSIAHSVIYCLQPEMGALGANIINFPMTLAHRFFRQTHEMSVCAWFSKVSTDMQKRGMRIGGIASTPAPPSSTPHIKQENEDEDILQSSACRWQTCNDASAYTQQYDSSDETSDGASPASTNSTDSSRTTFIHEDPSKYYVDKT